MPLPLVLIVKTGGTLIDFFGGIHDIEHKKLRVLHRFSFLDDPTRIIRGLRLALRLGFSFQDKTNLLMKEALKFGNFKRISKPRIIKEFSLLFSKKMDRRITGLLKQFPIFHLLDLDPRVDESKFSIIKRAECILDYFRQKNYNIKEWLIRMVVLLDGVEEKKTGKLGIEPW